MRPAAASASGSKMIPQRETAASKLACGKSRLEASDSMNSTLPRPAAAARSRPNASISAGDVRGHDAALRAGLARRGERRLAIAGGDVQDPASRLDVGELHQLLADMPGRRGR